MSQQIFLPLGGLYPIPHEYEADTMQVPRGQSSVLWELRDGRLTSAEAIILLCLNHGSTWNSGDTWCMSGPYLSKILGKGMTRQYAQTTLVKLTHKGWIETIDTDNPSGYRYRIRHHLCDPDEVPVNSDGKPLKFPVPRGPGGPLERCFDGDISWKAALVWIMLKLRSNWKAYEDTSGQTESATLLELSKRCRMKNAGFQKIITELTQAGMLHRLTPKSQAAIFQLYPKPFPRPVSSSTSTPPPSKARARPPSKETLEFDGEGYFDDTYYYSRNRLYRCNRETEIIEKRNGDHWSEVSDFHRSQVMLPPILEYFEKCLETKREFESALSSEK